MSKENELKRAKSQALMLLLFVTATFVLMVFLPRNWWTDAIKAVAEAAMVGALADWFAVTALFKKIPIPIISRHTEIIPQRKNQIAESLAIFVQEKFLNAASIVGLIKASDPVSALSAWLVKPAHAEQLGRFAVKWADGLLAVTNDAQVSALLRQAVHTFIGKVDFSKSFGVILDQLTRDGRHQNLLDQALGQLLQLLKNDETRHFISSQIMKWLKSRYSLMEKLLPSGWIADNGAELIEEALEKLLVEINENPEHELRQSFEASVHNFVERLKTDAALAAKGEEIKNYLRNDSILNAYLSEVWGDLSAWLRRDLHDPQSLVHRKVVDSAHWIGHALEQDDALRQALNQHMEELARDIAPGLSDYVSDHIRTTIRNWNATDMSAQIELSIGKDLQYIRINGTVVGGAIGLLLYLFSSFAGIWQVGAV